MVAPFIGGNLPLTGGNTFVSLKTQRHGKIYFVVELQATDTDTASWIQYSIVEKRQAYLELSYLCRTFVLLWKWQETDTATNQGKCLRRHNHSPKFLVRCCQARQGKARQGKDTTADGSRFYLELSYLCRTFVLLN